MIAPYVHDCLTARLAEVTGFRTFIVSASSLALTYAMPDLGLLTADDMIKAASRIADFLPYPVITDFPGGFSSTPYGVHHNVERLLPSGTQAVIIDDTTPGQDGTVVAEELYLAKIAAAVAATESTGCQVIAASAAGPSLGLDEAVHRLQRAEAVGAGLVMARGLTTLSECRTLAASVTAPTVLDEFTEHGGDDAITIDEAFALGFSIAAVRYVEKASLYGLMNFGPPDASRQHHRLPRRPRLRWTAALAELPVVLLRPVAAPRAGDRRGRAGSHEREGRTSMSQPTRRSLAEILASGQQMLAPCVYDSLSARAMELRAASTPS